MPGPNSPQSFSEARKEFKKQKKAKQKQKKQTKRHRVSKTRKARRHIRQAGRQARRKLSLKAVKAGKKKNRKTKKAMGKAPKTIRCDCGDKSYTGSELTPRGLGHCEECTLENVIRRGADGKLYRNTGDQDHRKWVKVLRD